MKKSPRQIVYEAVQEAEKAYAEAVKNQDLDAMIGLKRLIYKLRKLQAETG